MSIQNIRAFLFSVEITLERVQLAINFPCKLQISLKRGNQKLESAQVALDKGVSNFGNEKLKLQTRMYLDEVKKTFLDKKCTFTIALVTPKGIKAAGQASFDIATYLNQHKNFFEEQLKLEKCPDKNSLLKFKLDLQLIKEIDVDQISQMSNSSKLNDSNEEIKDATDTNQHENNDDPVQLRIKYEAQILQKNEIENNLKKQLEDQQKSNQRNVEEINKYINLIGVSKGEYEKLKIEFSQLKEQKVNEQKEQENKSKQLQNIDMQINILLINLSDIQTIKILEKEIEELNQTHQQFQDKMKRRDSEIRALSQDVQEKQKLFFDIQAESSGLKQQFCDVLDKLQQSEESNDHLKQCLIGAESKLEHFLQSDNQHELFIEECQDKITQSTDRRNQLEMENGKLVSQINKLQQRILGNEELIIEKDKTIIQLNNHLSQIQYMDKQKTIEIQQLKEKVDQLEAKCQNGDNSQVLLVQTQSLKKRNEDLESTIKKQEIDMKKIQQQESEYQNKINTLQQQLKQQVNQEVQKPVAAAVMAVTTEEILRVKESNKKYEQMFLQQNQQIAKLTARLESEQNTNQQMKTVIKDSSEKLILIQSKQSQSTEQVAYIIMMNEWKKEVIQLKAKLKEFETYNHSIEEEMIKLKCQMGDIFNAAIEFGGTKLSDQLFRVLGIKE